MGSIFSEQIDISTSSSQSQEKKNIYIKKKMNCILNRILVGSILLLLFVRSAFCLNYLPHARQGFSLYTVYMNKLDLTSPIHGEGITCSDIQEKKAFCPYLDNRTKRKYIKLRENHA